MNDDSSGDTEHGPTAVQRRGLMDWAVWIVPVVALAVAGYWVYRATIGSGPVITIHFHDGSGLRADQSALRYRGIQAGLVRRVGYAADGARVDVEVQLVPDAVFLTRVGSAFWIVRPEVTNRGVSGLGAIVTGSYIDSLAGTSEKTLEEFNGLEQRPETDYGGLNIVLVAKRIEKLRPGAELQYRGFPVGEVRRINLVVDDDELLVDVHVDSAYRKLIRSNSKFWSQGGLDFRFSLFGESELRTPSLSAALSGAIGLATPRDETGEAVSDGQRFALHERPDERWLDRDEKASGKPMPGTAAKGSKVAPAPATSLDN